MNVDDQYRSLTLRRNGRIAAIAGVVGAVLLSMHFIARDSRERSLSNADTKDLEAAVKGDATDSKLAFKLAYKMFQEGRAPEATELMERLVTKNPRSPEYWFGYAKALEETGQIGRALAAYKRAAELGPGMGHPHSGMANIYAKSGLATDAIHEYEIAKHKDPALKVSPTLWAKSLLAVGRYADVWDKLIQSISEYPTEEGRFVLLADSGIRLNRLQETRDLLLRRINMTRAYPVGLVRITLARVTLASHPSGEDLRKAESLCRDAMPDPGRDVRYDVMLARVLVAEGKQSEAIGTLAAAVVKTPDDVDGTRLLAELYENQGRQDKAAPLRERIRERDMKAVEIAALRKAADDTPRDAQLRIALAEHLFRDGEFGAAAEECLRALQIRPGDPTSTRLFADYRENALKRLEDKARAEVAENQAALRARQ